MKYIKFVICGLISAALLVSTTANAATLTEAQVNAIINLLQSFGADSSVITNVRVALTGSGSPAQDGFCHNWTRNLTVGASGADAEALSNAMLKEVPEYAPNFTPRTGVFFDERLASAVVAFQEKYRSEILTPISLARGTGYVGPATRRVLNRLYGCGNSERLFITPAALPTAIVGTRYLDSNEYIRLTAHGFTSPSANIPWVIIEGSLPPGLMLNPAFIPCPLPPQGSTDFRCPPRKGEIIGIPTTAGNYTFVIQATSDTGEIARRTYTLTVRGANQPSITVLSPKGNETWDMKNESFTVRWTPADISWDDGMSASRTATGNVYLYLVNPANTLENGGGYFLGEGKFDNGTFTWIRPINDARLSANFFRNDSKIALVVYSSRMTLPHPALPLRPVSGSKPYIVYSEAFVVKAITIDGDTGKIIFPAGGEKFTIGNPLVIRWTLPKNQVNVSPILTLAIGEVVYPSLDATSYTWRDTTKNVICEDYGCSNIPVTPGQYKFRLQLRLSDGSYYDAGLSNYFEFVNP